MKYQNHPLEGSRKRFRKERTKLITAARISLLRWIDQQPGTKAYFYKSNRVANNRCKGRCQVCQIRDSYFYHHIISLQNGGDRGSVYSSEETNKRAKTFKSD